MSDQNTINIHLGKEFQKQPDLLNTGSYFYKDWKIFNQTVKSLNWLFLLLNELQTNGNSFEYLEENQAFSCMNEVIKKLINYYNEE